MFRRKVLVIGYYHRKNLGDDAFEYALINFFSQDKNIEYSIINIDELKSVDANVSAVIFGGGDLVNDYFFVKIQPFISKKTCPWYAISIGIPYPSLIDKGYLDGFDYIIHRNKADEKILQDKYPGRSEWFPDMSFLIQQQNLQNLQKDKSLFSSTKKIGIFLSRHMYSKDSKESYKKIVDNIAKTLSNISKKSGYFRRPVYSLHLYSFCTDGKEGHDDRIIGQDVFLQIKKYGHLGNVSLNGEIAVEDVSSLFNTFHMTICSRFHAHMFSFMAKVPFLSIYTTRKVDNLLTELGAEKYSYRLKTQNDIPIELDADILLSKFNLIESQYEVYKNALSISHKLYTDKTFEFSQKLSNLIFLHPVHNAKNEVEQNAVKKATEIADILISRLDIFDKVDIMKDRDNLIYQNGAIANYFSKEFQIPELISYILTGDKKSVYLHGLSEQVFTEKYNLLESCKWILLDFCNFSKEFIGLDNTVKKKYRKINIKGNDKLENYHRSGWSYVVKGLEKLDNPNGVLFDAYLDKTFGWEANFLSFVGVIPYTKPWIGIFHHTSNTDYSENNLSKCFANPDFIDSLKWCKGLIVFSKANEEWILSKIQNIPVLCLIHPTEFVETTFDYASFKKNPNKKVIQIGAWLRDSYAIYELSVPKEYGKVVLKGKDMSNYFASDSDILKIVETIKDFDNGEGNTGNSGCERTSNCLVNSDKYLNKYIVGLTNLIQNNHHSVLVLNKVDNAQYDELLKNNIVFIKLVDASAVNTVLECIARNTPILVNRLPATEEYLGKDYPLFYDSLSEAECLLNRKNIKRAHIYLANMDKTKFTLKSFINSLVKSKMYNSLV